MGEIYYELNNKRSTRTVAKFSLENNSVIGGAKISVVCSSVIALFELKLRLQQPQQQQQPLASKRILNGRWPFSPNDTLPMRQQQEYFSRHWGNGV